MVLVSHVNVGQTIVQNTFIDRYMAAANGEYVKVYLSESYEGKQVTYMSVDGVTRDSVIGPIFCLAS